MAVNVHYNEGYTTMCNHHLRDVSLSWQAKGMLSFMFSNREDFKYSINGLTKCASNGDTSVRSILNELKEKGYLIVTPIKGNNGRIECWDYDFFETPDDAKQFEGRPHVENTHVENQGQRNTNISSTNSRINTPISPITKRRNTNISSPSIPQGDVIEWSEEEELFEKFRLAYQGSKNGHDTEFKNFKKHKDWKEVVRFLLPAHERQEAIREQQKRETGWRPQPKNLKTWINNRCWEEEIKYDSNQTNTTSAHGTHGESLQEWADRQPKLVY